MPFGLIIGTERAQTLQNAIEAELTAKGFTPEPDHVMAEYITIMVINNKTAAQITNELEDLIGADYDPSFTDWLFIEAAKGGAGAEAPIQVPITPPEPVSEPGPSREVPPHLSNDVSSRRPLNAGRNGIYQQALSQVIPSTGSAQKRTASARSPSPTSHPSKTRRTDVPTGPRAMYRDGSSAPSGNSRSLLDRVGGPAGPNRSGSGNANGYQRDDVQARIDNIVNSSPDQNMMVPGGFPGMGGMDMNMLAATMGNPMLLQEMMMNQMAMINQMATILGPAGQFPGQGFPMQGVMPGEMGMFPGGMNNGFQGQQMGGHAGNGPMNGSGRGRGSARGRGSSRGRGGSTTTTSKTSEPPASVDGASAVAAPTPVIPNPSVPAPSAAELTTGAVPVQPIPYAIPERPQSPTLCKFGPKCTNAHCRYSHPSPVATAESGIVLSNEACENGKDCKDKDCVKAHVSPAVLNPLAVATSNLSISKSTPSIHTPTHTSHNYNNNPVPCRFGAACTRPNCAFTHPQRNGHFTTQCRFGAACTRATCQFQHPEGRVLPSTFHRGLSSTSPLVNVQTPETGSMGGNSPHKSLKLNNPAGSGAGVKEKLEQQMKEIEEKKRQAEKAVKDAEAAANSKKDENKPVAIAA